MTQNENKVNGKHRRAKMEIEEKTKRERKEGNSKIEMQRMRCEKKLGFSTNT